MTALPISPAHAPVDPAARTGAGTGTARAFGTLAIGCAVVACLLAGLAPIGFSIATVFLFAGPHNWMEARFFLERMPPRWGALARYYATGLAGVVALTVGFAALPWVASSAGWSREGWLVGIATWNTLLVAWVLGLCGMRWGFGNRADRDWVYPAGLLLIGVAWLRPTAWSLALVYVHPLVALWFLDREMRRHRPSWRRAYHRTLWIAGGLLLALWWWLAGRPNLPGEDGLTLRITRHAGAGVLTGVSTHLLVATHTYLEMLHYAVWLVAMPCVGMRTRPWSLRSVPLFRKSPAWRIAVLGVVGAGLLAVLGFWAAFVANYPVTRDVYFTVAMLHVLAEVPFLLRTLR